MTLATTRTTRLPKSLTPERVKELKRLAVKIDREEQGEIKALGRSFFRQSDALRAAGRSLRAGRERRGWSVADAAARTGLSVEVIATVEDAPGGDVTFCALTTYATALEMEVSVSVGDRPVVIDGAST